MSESQFLVERDEFCSIDKASEPTAVMLATIMSDLSDNDTDKRVYYNFGYFLGKWIYLIDALDDYDKDIKKKAYNPFYLAYQAGSREELMQTHGEEVQFVFRSLFFDIRENLSNISFRFNRDLLDNVLLRGLPATTEKIMHGCKCHAKRKDKKAEKENTK